MAASSSSVVAIADWTDLRKCLQDTKNQGSKLLVLEFTASWSEPCNFMKPTVEGIASRFSNTADFRTVDVDKFQGLARDLGLEALPVFLLVKEFKVVGRIVGVKGAELQSSIESNKR